MTRLPLAAILSLSVLAACTVKTTSSNPDDGKYDGYYSETKDGGGAAGDDGDSDGADTADKPKVRTMTSTRAAPPRKGRALAARKPPVTGGDKPRPPRATPSTPSEALALDGFYPTNAPAGSVIEILGSGFGKAAQTTVTIGGKRQRVVEVGDGYMVVAIAGNASGPVVLSRARTKGAPVTSDSPFHVVGLGSPRTDAAHGLVANVYSIASPVKELPAADTLGEPFATFAVDNLDIPSTQFKGSFKGADNKDVSEWFAVHFRGSLNVTESGTYDLCLNSGDGALLFLDQTPIVDNDGVHDTKETCESIAIEPGEYQLDLMWFQAEAGELGLQLLWAKDGGAKAPIPRANLFPPEDVATMARR